VNSRNQLLDPASNPISDALGERTGQLPQAIHQPRSQTLRASASTVSFASRRTSIEARTSVLIRLARAD
jgi:hypothetical protein